MDTLHKTLTLAEQQQHWFVWAEQHNKLWTTMLTTVQAYLHCKSVMVQFGRYNKTVLQ